MSPIGTLLLTLALLSAAPAAADTVTVFADRDATLIEDPGGAWANGTGPLFVGRTSQSEGSRRRALLRFDVAGAVPRQAIVESVELTLHLDASNPGGSISVFRLLADWSEGPTFSGGGGGRPSQPGDATWVHTRYPDETWVRPGGHFVARASAVTPIDGAGLYTWADRRHMIEDVRLWLRSPQRNFGWILIGDESMPQTAKNFASREDADPDLRPRLTIVYRLPGV